MPIKVISGERHPFFEFYTKRQLSVKQYFLFYKNYITNSVDLEFPIRISIYQTQSCCYTRIFLENDPRP